MRPKIYRHFISILFLSIFAIKMGLSVAPLIFSVDKQTVSAVILQLELENHPEKEIPEAKDLTKLLKKGSELNLSFHFAILSHGVDVLLRYFEKARHYVNSYYPSVITPPPNFLLVSC